MPEQYATALEQGGECLSQLKTRGAVRFGNRRNRTPARGSEIADAPCFRLREIRRNAPPLKRCPIVRVADYRRIKSAVLTECAECAGSHSTKVEHSGAHYVVHDLDVDARPPGAVSHAAGRGARRAAPPWRAPARRWTALAHGWGTAGDARRTRPHGAPSNTIQGRIAPGSAPQTPEPRKSKRLSVCPPGFARKMP